MSRCFSLLSRSLCTGLLVLSASVVAAEDYPALYDSLLLPKYPGAQVVSVGRDNTQLRDGMSVTLKTADAHITLRRFFEIQMPASGWTLQETTATTKMRAAGLLDKLPFMAVFCRSDGAAVQFFTSDQGQVRVVEISASIGSNSCSATNP